MQCLCIITISTTSLPFVTSPAVILSCLPSTHLYQGSLNALRFFPTAAQSPGKLLASSGFRALAIHQCWDLLSHFLCKQSQVCVSVLGECKEWRNSLLPDPLWRAGRNSPLLPSCRQQNAWESPVAACKLNTFLTSQVEGNVSPRPGENCYQRPAVSCLYELITATSRRMQK